MRGYSHNKYDVAVMGGGPAGSTAARVLSTNGIRVVVIEKAVIPRYKTCGGGIVGRAIQALPFSLDRTLQHSCFTVDLNCLDAGLHFTSNRNDPIISMVMRDEFDAMLLARASDAGADLLPACVVNDVRQDSDGVKLTTDRGEFVARFLIAADGAMSGIARKAGWSERLHVVPALEYEVYVDEELMQQYYRRARFDFGVVPNGYAWVFPKNDHLSIGVLTVK